MTCVVGIESKGKIYIGADGLSVSDEDIRHMKEPKVIKNEMTNGHKNELPNTTELLNNLSQQRLIYQYNLNKNSKDSIDLYIQNTVDHIMTNIKIKRE